VWNRDEVEVFVEKGEVNHDAGRARRVAEERTGLGKADSTALRKIDYKRRENLGCEMDAVSAGSFAGGTPKVCPLEGLDVLAIANISAAPDPMLILINGGLDSEGKGNVVLWAKAGGGWRGWVVSRVLIFDSGKDQIIVGVNSEVGCDLVDLNDKRNDEGLHRIAFGTIVAGEGIGANDEAVVDRVATRTGAEER